MVYNSRLSILSQIQSSSPIKQTQRTRHTLSFQNTPSKHILYKQDQNSHNVLRKDHRPRRPRPQVSFSTSHILPTQLFHTNPTTAPPPSPSPPTPAPAQLTFPNCPPLDAGSTPTTVTAASAETSTTDAVTGTVVSVAGRTGSCLLSVRGMSGSKRARYLLYDMDRAQN